MLFTPMTLSISWRCASVLGVYTMGVVPYSSSSACCLCKDDLAVCTHL
jgi:hypothetical protein